MTVIARSGPLIGVQRRLVELGRIRLGEKGPKGEPRKLNKLRLTSASESHLLAAVAIYGGTVRPWKGAPDEGYFEAYLDSAEIDIMVPPALSAYSQFYEIWTGGGCVSRCDGISDLVRLVECDHPREHPGHRVTTRVSVMLAKVPGLGTWRLETHGWNAAATLPPTLEMLGAVGAGGFVPAVLRLEQRTAKVKGQTKRFVVPVIDLRTATIENLLATGGVMPAAPALVGPNRRDRVERPALGTGQVELERAEDFGRPERPEPAAPLQLQDPDTLLGGLTPAEVQQMYPDGLPETEQPSTDDAPAVSDQSPRPLIAEQLKVRLADFGIGTALVGPIARELFPGLSNANQMTDEQRGQLWQEIKRRRGIEEDEA